MKSAKLDWVYPSVVFTVVLLLLFGMSFISIRTSATSNVPTPMLIAQENEKPWPQSERQLGVGVPKHLPIKIKAKHINNEKWAQDLEIEVTNKSDKPIYYLSFLLVIQGVKAEDGREFAFWLHYGRAKLNDFSTPLESTDVPLLPNDTCVLKIPEGSANGWELTRAKKNYAQPLKVGLVFQMLNFGDGTGFNDSGGTFIDKHKKLGAIQNSLSPPTSTGSTNANACSFIPAVFMPVNFWSSVSSVLNPPDVCCGDDCQRLKSTFYTCQRVCDPDNPDKPSAATVGCTDPEGACRKQIQHYESCWYEGTPLSCSITQLFPCCELCGPEGEGDTCHDGFDNDGDGFTDCAEPDCHISGGFYESDCGDGVDNDCDGPIDCYDSDCNDDWRCFDYSSGCTLAQIAFCQQMQAYCYMGSCYTPILIDTLGDGFRLTTAQNGVSFDLGGGQEIKVAWTESNSDDAWLALDRNGNGQIDSGKELFGNFTEQPTAPERHGFLALAVFDAAAQGGNGDARIDSRDAIYTSLRLWQDLNHNGISEPAELKTLPALDVTGIECTYHESKKTDEHGNRYRYRAKVYDQRGSKVGRWAWDVFLQMAP